MDLKDGQAIRCLGVDLGQAQDHPSMVTAVGMPKTEKWLTMIKELPLQLSYVTIADAILKLENHHDIVIVDSGGVGRAVLDMLRKEKSKAWGLGLTGSGKGKIDRGRRMMTMAKRKLVMGVRLHLVDGLIKVSPDVGKDDALAWLEQMRAFQAKGNKFEAASGTHDDIVIATANAIFGVEQYPLLEPDQ
ncbi:MAG: hypothetical protein AAF423_14185 [Pseudomonadota bacterium]